MLAGTATFTESEAAGGTLAAALTAGTVAATGLTVRAGSSAHAIPPAM